jgi:hypothetical protein
VLRYQKSLTNLRAALPAFLLLSGMALAQTSPAPPVLYAEADYDCAPWDGSAFAISIQPIAGVKQIKPPTIHVSIWQAPDLPGGGRFAFPDSSGKIGAAYLQLSASDSPTQLRGTVSFTSVSPGKDVEGQVDLADPRGKRYTGRFTATWTGKRVMCGG